MTGISISTAALVIVLSAFNGLEDLVISLFSSFEPEIKIEAVHSKSFERQSIPDDVYHVDGLRSASEVIEEIAIFRHEDRFMIGTLKGVEASFLGMSEMNDHLMDGVPVLQDQYGPLALVGVGALEKLDAQIFPAESGMETFTVYSPKKDQKISRSSADAFETSQIPVVGTFSFNNEVNDNFLVVPIAYAAETMNFGDQITSVEMKFAEGTDLLAKKNELSGILGDEFRITTKVERNGVIYQTSASEKWMTTLLLGFIFFLATFNMVASITMLVLEKRNDLGTMMALGARRKQLERIFYLEGLLINGLGLIIGLGLGYLVCYVQQTFGIVAMEGSHAEYFPVSFRLSDLFLILTVTMACGILAAYLPSKILVRRVLPDLT